MMSSNIISRGYKNVRVIFGATEHYVALPAQNTSGYACGMAMIDSPKTFGSRFINAADCASLPLRVKQFHPRFARHAKFMLDVPPVTADARGVLLVGRANLFAMRLGPCLLSRGILGLGFLAARLLPRFHSGVDIRAIARGPLAHVGGLFGFGFHTSLFNAMVDDEQ
jgi:hypothetical protein